MRERTTRYVLLGALAVGGSMTGYELRQWISARLGSFWSESFGQIYPELRGLLETAAIVEAQAEGDGRPYRITSVGRQMLADWLDRPAKAAKPRNEVQLRLNFGRYFGADTARNLLKGAEAAAASRFAAAQRTLIDTESDPATTAEDRVFAQIAVDRSRMLAEAERLWAQRSLEVLDALEAEGPPAALERLSRRR